MQHHIHRHIILETEIKKKILIAGRHFDTTFASFSDSRKTQNDHKTKEHTE